MAHTPHTWNNGDVVSAAVLNALEQDLAAAATSSDVAALIGAAPNTLNTLQELAAAIGNDPTYAADLATQLAGKTSPADVDAKIAAQAASDSTTSLAIARKQALIFANA